MWGVTAHCYMYLAICYNLQSFTCIHFLFASAVFQCLSNDIAFKDFFQHCVVFLLFCIAIVISELFFCRGLFLALFCCYRTEKVCSSICLV